MTSSIPDTTEPDPAESGWAAPDSTVTLAGPVAIIGTGMIGRSWAIAFARGGVRVALYDAVDGAAQAAHTQLAAQLEELDALALLGSADATTVGERVRVAENLDDALEGVTHVQENAPETVELKRRLFLDLLDKAPATANIASSSSALLPSAFVPDDEGATRCLVAHPLNPPHLVPAVELVPGPRTAVETMQQVRILMEAIGQRTIVLSRELEGFVMNRLQGALLDEAMRLVDTGIVSVEGVDRAVKDGLGLRWSFMGPIETIDLNAPEGVLDYVARYGDAYRSIASSGGKRIDWDAAFAARLDEARREVLPRGALAERRDWRDRQLMALAIHRERTRGDH